MEDALIKKVQSLGVDGKPAEGAAASGKYVPPSQRAREAAASADAGKTAEREPSNSIRIANLSDIVTDQDIRQLCSAFGPVSRVYLARDMDTGRSRGFAFVTFHSMLDAEKAAARLHGHLYGSMVLAANMAENRDRKQ